MPALWQRPTGVRKGHHERARSRKLAVCHLVRIFLIAALWLGVGCADDDLEASEASDFVENGEKRPAKAGSSVLFEGLETFVRLRIKLDGCLTEARLSKDSAANAIARVMIPEALDYPA